MFQYINGKVISRGTKKFIINDLIGVETFYLGTRQSGEFFLYPYIDDNKKTVIYFAFDTVEQKTLYEGLVKINGIGFRTAFNIIQIPESDFNKAVKDLDVRFFQNIQGIGPKTAKKIILECKNIVNQEDFKTLEIDEKMYKSIVNSLKGFGYDKEKVKNVLKDYDQKISKDNMSEVIKWIISRM